MDMGTGTWVEGNIVQPVQALVNQLAAFVPRLLGAIALFVIGWLVAKGVERGVVELLKALTLDRLSDQIGVSSALTKGGIKHKLSGLIGVIVYWLVMLAVIMVVFNALELTVAAELFQSVVVFLPNVIAALFILIVGMFAASFLSSMIKTAASNAGILQAHLFGQLVQTIVVIFSAVAALQQLNIPFFGEVFLIILAGISLGSAIAFGLGCKDIAGAWVSGIVEQVQGRRR